MALKKDIIETEFRTSGASKLQGDISKVEGNIKRLHRENERLLINRKKLEAQGKKNTKAWKNINDQIKTNTTTLDKYNKELGELNSQLKLTDKTAKQLTKDKRALARELNNTSKALDPKKWARLNKEYKATQDQLTKVRSGVNKTSKTLSLLKSVLPIAGVGVLIAGLKRLGSELFTLTKTIQGDAVRSSVVFGDQLGFVRKESEKLARQMGFTNREFVAAAAGTADLLIPLDFTRKQAASMSVELQSLAGALDEWTGGQLGAKTVSEILTKAMLGENEQLKQLGIAIRKDTDEFRDLVKIKIRDTGATKVQAEAMATLELIQKKSADAQAAYNREGNRLLRTQKALSVRIGNLKENFVGLFEVPIAKQLEQTRESANLMAAQLLNVNIEEEKRFEIYKKLKQIAPDIVEGINQENINTEDLVNNLIAYNDEMGKKIALESLNEEQQKILIKQQKERSELILSQTSALKSLNETQKILTEKGVPESVLKSFDELRKMVTDLSENEIDNTQLNLLFDTIFEGSQQISTSAGFASDAFRRSFLAILANAENIGDSYRSSIDKNKDVLAELQESQRILSESFITPGGEGDGDDGVVGKRLAAAKVLYKEQLNLLKKFLVEREITQEEFDEREIRAQIKLLEIEKETLIKQGRETTEIETKILDNKIELLKNRRAEAEKEKKKTQELNLKLYHIAFDESVQAEIDLVMKEVEIDNFLYEQKRKNAEKEKKAQKKDDKERAEEIVNLSENIANAYANSFQERRNLEKQFTNDSIELQDRLRNKEISLQEFKDQMLELDKNRAEDDKNIRRQALRDVLLSGLDFLKKFARQKEIELTVANIAKFGAVAGGIRSLIQVAAIEAALAGAKLLINNLYEGGHTGPGTKHEPTGIVHANEYVIPQEGYFNPNIRPFIDMIENARQAGSLRTLNMAGVGLPGHVDGGPTTQQVIQPASIDPEVISLLRANIAWLEKIFNEGVFTVIGDFQVREIRDRTNTINDIESSVSK